MPTPPVVSGGRGALHGRVLHDNDGGRGAHLELTAIGVDNRGDPSFEGHHWVSGAGLSGADNGQKSRFTVFLLFLRLRLWSLSLRLLAR
jgi:hypothetical protein